MTTKIRLWDLNNTDGVLLKGCEIKKYALKNLAQMHRIKEDLQIHRNDLKGVSESLEYLKDICNFDIKEEC